MAHAVATAGARAATLHFIETLRCPSARFSNGTCAGNTAIEGCSLDLVGMNQVVENRWKRSVHNLLPDWSIS